MSNDTDKNEQKKHVPIKFGSKQHEQLISSSYGTTLRDANVVVEQRTKNFASVPFEEFSKARSLKRALSSAPVVTATHRRPLSHG